MYISVAESIYGVYMYCAYVYEALQHVFNGVNVRVLAYMQLSDYLRILLAFCKEYLNL